MGRDTVGRDAAGRDAAGLHAAGRGGVALEVVCAPAGRVEDAIGALLSAGPSAAARFVRQAEAAAIRLDRIFCLSDAFGRYRMAVLAVPSLGRTAMLLATPARHRDDIPNLARAIRAACDASHDVADIAQALLETNRELDREAFESAGLTALATLDYLELSLDQRLRGARSTALPEGWTIEPAAPGFVLDGAEYGRLDSETRREIAQLLEATYRETLDCPGLAGLRATADVLEGHFGTGVRRRHWLLARERGAARGVCLLNLSPDGQGCELVYFGLAPEARGRGVGAILLDAGLDAVARSGAATVSLAVDERNTPAKKLYESRGFRRVSSRVALVQALRAEPTR
jgi:ribosomal protein S18 acetylase RimI-like enzyme